MDDEASRSAEQAARLAAPRNDAEAQALRAKLDEYYRQHGTQATQSAQYNPGTNRSYSDGMRHSYGSSHYGGYPGSQQHEGPDSPYGYGPPMTADQHMAHARNLEYIQRMDELRRMEDQRRAASMQYGHYGRSRQSVMGNMQHGDMYGGGMGYPMMTGHYPGADFDPRGYTEHQHAPGFVIDPRLMHMLERAYNFIEPMVHRIEVDLRT